MVTKEYYSFLCDSQSIISFNALKLARNKRMCTSDKGRQIKEYIQLNPNNSNTQKVQLCATYFNNVVISSSFRQSLN